MTNSNSLLHLEGLTESERRYALQVLSELSQNKLDAYNNLRYADYNEIPVDIETFLTDDRYLGNAWKDTYGKLKLYDFWLEQLKKLFPNNIDTAYNTLLESGARGIGKAQPLDAKVMTPTGYRLMGDLKIGDKVIGADGKSHSIIAVFPQGEKDVYQVSFTDGSNTECCKEHLWRILPRNSNKWARTVELQELFDKPLYNLTKNRYKERKYYIPMTDPIDFPAQDFYIHPYILGCLIGDGHIGDNILSMTSADLEILDRMQQLMDKFTPNYFLNKLSSCRYGYTIKQKVKRFKLGIKNNPIALPNEYLEELKRLKLAVNSKDKFIPELYLYNSIENRIELLRGLMDTDGTITKAGNTIQFNTISSKLRDDIIQLIESLGGSAWYSETQGAYIDKELGEKVLCNISYTISMRLPKTINPFYLSRKANRINPRSNNPSRAIESITYSRKSECKCILLDSEDHLYLTDHCIVTHNSEVACGCVGAYLLYRVMCLKNPLEYFNLKQTEKICFAFMNIKLDLAEEIAISKFQKTIQMSPWFMSKGRMTSYHSKPYWIPPEPIQIIIGSQSDDVIGLPIYYAFFDEISFIKNQDIDKQKAKAKDMIDTAIGGMMTRFVHKGKNPTMLVVASSKRSEQSFMEEYIKTLSKTQGNSTLVIDKPVWEVKPKGTYSDEIFYVGLGNKFLESIVIPDDDYNNLDAYRKRGYQILEVPIDFKPKFIEDIERNLCDFAGVSSSASSKYISAAAVNLTLREEFKNPMPDILEIGNAPDDTAQYYNFFDLDKIPKDLMYKPLYIHLDMSVSGDMTGIAGIWIAGKKVSTDDNLAKDLSFRLAFSTSIKAPKGRQISFEKNRNFIYWLKDQGFNIKGISTDTFQSVDTGQALTARGYNYSPLSVDRVDTDRICKPYQYFRSCIYEKRVEMYYSARLFDEVISLEKNNNTGKVDHPPNGHKDVSDAVCGAIYNASKNAEQYAFDYGEDLEVTQEISNDTNQLNQQQITIDFEAEMMKLLDPIHENNKKSEANNANNQSNISSSSMYLYDGIIVF